MSRVYTTTQINRPVDAVFAFVTTPAHWPRWHPSSRGVSGATDHPLHVGEQVTEAFQIAWWNGQAVWTVCERRKPHCWIIEAEVEGGGAGTIAYALTPRAGGTHFERTFSYTMPTRWLSLMDHLLIRRIMAVESARALRRLKALLAFA